ncbi:MAG: hypothetical protein M3151_00315 [Actinomycetota bacterium]|nr:hypothetical protein [Actinomycetota bacterium]
MTRADTHPELAARELLAGSAVTHEIRVPREVLTPGEQAPEDAEGGIVRMRPLNVAVLTLISRAAREDPALIPLLMIKESLIEPTLTLDQIRQMHVGLVHFLVGKANSISGLAADGAALDETADSPLGQTHILLAKHFGWTPEQVSQLTPGQVAVYLAGVQRLLRLEEETGG